MSVKEIEQLLSDFKEKYAAGLDELYRNGEKLHEASERISRSWSGSFAGWHGSMYFRDFQVPSIHERFNGEWGGLNGLPAGWQEKQPEAVRAKIEAMVGDKFSIDDFERSIATLRDDLQNLRVEILDAASHESLGQRESELLKEIQSSVQGKPKSEFIQQGLPNTMMSRDTEALRQGMCVPAWLYYEAVGLSARSLVDATKGAFRLTERFLKLTQTITSTRPAPPSDSIKGLHPEIYQKCSQLFEQRAYPEAVEKGFKVVRDRLRKLTGHETGSEAFGKTKLHIRGAAAPNVDDDFNHGVKFLTMAIDRFRNEKSHTSDAKIDDPVRAYEYLRLSSLAMHLLDNAEILP
jgi:uncharacterized protein (TIGR02391 family)